MISDKEFPNFNPKIFVAACFLEHNGDILLLKRNPDKHYGDKWSSPGGKIDKGESESEAAAREVFEETGIKIDPDKIRLVERSFVRFDDMDFMYTFYVYKIDSVDRPDVKITDKEHSAYMWISPVAALNLDLMQDEDYCIKKAYNLG